MVMLDINVSALAMEWVYDVVRGRIPLSSQLCAGAQTTLPLFAPGIYTNQILLSARTPNGVFK